VNGERQQSESKPAARMRRDGRLRRHGDFERVYKQGRRHFAAHLTVFYLRRELDNGLRVGFTVGRALGGAVERNRMKRRLREAVRRHWPKEMPPADVVINPKKTLLKADFTELENDIRRAFEVIQKSLKAPSGKNNA